MSTPLPPPGRRAMLYENTYVWLVFVASMDIFLTRLVLWHHGREVNPLAAWVINQFGLVGMVLFKFVLTVLVILVSETVGRRSPRAGRRFARVAVAISCVPVAVAAIQLAGRVV